MSDKARLDTLLTSWLQPPDKAGSRIERSQLIEVLHAVQAEFGYLPGWSLPVLAGHFNITRAEVYGVASFYDDFRLADTPCKPPMVQVCRAEACQAVGGRELYQALQGQCTTSSVYCLGNCALGPSVLLGERVYGRVNATSPAAVQALLAKSRRLPDTPPGSTSNAKLHICLGLDSGSLSLGADQLIEPLDKLAETAGVALVLTGGRGLYHLEPLVEIEADGQRHAFTCVESTVVDGLLQDGRVNQQHPNYAGLVEQLPELACQSRVTFARAGVANPLDYPAYARLHGLEGLHKALSIPPQQVIEQVTQSGLRGRGGAGFPTGIKWQTVCNTNAAQKYVVCNADEGDSGTFADRLLMESDPYCLIEGMAIAGYAVGASYGYIYLRSEYPLAARRLTAALAEARQQGLLGSTIFGSDFAFDIELRIGAGAYICGEETSLLESLEGKRGTIRYKPPLPAIEGAFGQPTALNNVITLASVPEILRQGAEAYRSLGVGTSRGTLTVQLAGNCKRGGLYEVPFGCSLRKLVEDIGGGTSSGRPVRAVQVGGPLGAYFPPELLDTKLDYEAFARLDGLIGHGGVVVFDQSVDLAEQAEYALRFCAHESCGKCTPCRIGSTRGAELVAQLRSSNQQAEKTAKAAKLIDLCELMEQTSLCALGGLTPYPVRSALKYFPQDFGLTTTATPATPATLATPD